MFQNKLNYKLLNVLIIALIIFLGLITFNYWGGILSKVVAILMPFLIGFAIAYALYPAVKKLEEKGVRKNIAVTVIVAFIAVIIVGILWMTVHLFYDQLVTLSSVIGDVLTDFSDKFSVNLGDFRDTVNNIMNNAIKGVGEYVSNGTVNIVSKSLDVFTQGIIVAIVSIYFLSDMDNIRFNIKNFLKNGNKKHYELVKTMDRELGRYLSGLAIFMFIQFVEYSLLFLVVGHPNWLLLGLLACITTVIPYFGGLFTNLVAVVLASVVSFPLFIATVIICLVFPNIDGYIISPKVYGKTNNINPLWTIFAVFAGGVLYGFMGIVIALPLYILLRCIFNFYKKDLEERFSRK